MITRSIRFDPKLNDKLMDAAEKRHVSINWLIHKLLEEGVERLAEEIRVTE